MKVNDAIAGALFLALGLAVIAASMQFPAMPGQPYGAATFPLVIGGGFVVVALVLIVQGIVGWRALPGIVLQEWGRSPRAIGRIALTVGLVVLYIAFSGQLGFVPSAFIVLAVLFLALRVHPLVALGVAALGTLVVQQAFGVLLRVPLPRNDILSFLW